MRLSPLHVVLAIVLALVAGCLGAVVANHFDRERRSAGLHEFVHNELNLDAEQAAKLDVLESEFSGEHRRLEAGLRAANVKLATAMEEEHTYGPKVGAAIDEVHKHMGDLQKATVRHVFAMRRLLNDKQKKQFDRQVWRSLTGNTRE